MRISTAGIHQAAVTAMLQQQTSLSKLQNQIATGKRVQTPADDPVAAVHILELNRALKEADQYKANADVASNRLALEEQALQEVGSVLLRVRELAVQANNAPVGEEDRQMIAAELRQRLNQLIDIGNRKDGNGEYLFAGFSTQTQPFSKTVAGVAYDGDQGNRMLQVGPTQRVYDSHSGRDVFLSIPEGNGTFVLGASPGNTGEGVLGAGTVVSRNAWQPDDYTIRFTSPDGDYEVLDSNGTQVAAGTYTEGTAIEFRGIKIEMDGMPAEDDEFTVARSRTEDVFTTVQDLLNALEGTPPTTQANFNSEMGRILQQLDQASDHILKVRAEVGARMSSLDAAEASREDHKLELQRMKSDLEDLDYADALAKMNQQLVGLQAAQASYMNISQLSLFNYLK